MAAKWVTVTVTDPDGRRHSLDVQATSTYDAAHLYVVEAKKERAVGLPKVTLATVFEVVADGKVYPVKGEVLHKAARACELLSSECGARRRLLRR